MIKKIYKSIPLDLSSILIWTMSTFVFNIIPIFENSIMRTILGIPMILFVPGYVLISALFSKKNDLEYVERIALSFGLSIAVVSLLGLILNFTFGIRLIPILITLCVYTVLLIIIAAYRRGKLPVEEQFSVSFHKIYTDTINIISDVDKLKDRTDHILTIILIIALILTVGMIYYAITTPKIGEKFTEFYILNTSGKADNYPVNFEINSTTVILVGVANHEYSPINYTLNIDLDKNILTAEKLNLDYNETWEKNVTFVPNKKGTNMKLEFLLFKENNLTIPYRELYLWVNTT